MATTSTAETFPARPAEPGVPVSGAWNEPGRAIGGICQLRLGCATEQSWPLRRATAWLRPVLTSTRGRCEPMHNDLLRAGREPDRPRTSMVALVNGGRGQP
jgi:hypothetical protein